MRGEDPRAESGVHKRHAVHLSSQAGCITSRSRWAPTADRCGSRPTLPRGVRSTRHLKLSYSSHRIGSRATKNMGTIALDYTTHCLWLPLFAQIGTVPLWLITALTSLQKRWHLNILAPI